MMDFSWVVKERRSIRQYEDRPISDELLESILQDALWAPSAVNLQPWYFVVVRSEEKRKALDAIVNRTSDILRPSIAERFKNNPEVVEETLHFVDKLGGAPVCVLAFQLRQDYQKTDSSIIQSVSAAIQNLLLSAWNQGVGSCWLTAPLEVNLGETLRQVFAPESGDLIAMITLGYPKKASKTPRRKEGRYTIV